jgi:hypothetical protein
MALKRTNRNITPSPSLAGRGSSVVTVGENSEIPRALGGEASRSKLALLSKSNLPSTVLDQTASIINQTGKLVNNSGGTLSKLANNFITNPQQAGRKTLISYLSPVLNLFSITKYISALRGFMTGNARQSVADFISGLILNSVASDSKKLALANSSGQAKELFPNSLIKLAGIGIMEFTKQLDSGSGRLNKLGGSESMRWGVNSLFTEVFSPIQGIVNTALFGRGKVSTPDVDFSKK